MAAMSRKSHDLRYLPLLLAVCLLGCGGGSDVPEDNSPVDESTSAQLKSVSAAELPKLGDFLPPLPPNKPVVRVASPATWVPKQRDASFLCAFTEKKGQNVPAIVVKIVEPPAVDGFENVDQENVADFAAAVQATLKDPLEDAVPLLLGEHAFARYVKRASLNNLPVEQQVLATMKNGRMFTVELRVRPGKPEEFESYRDQAYAVAAGLEFLAGADEQDKPPPAAPEKQ